MAKIIGVILIIISMLIASYAQIILKKGAEQKNIYINRFTITGYSLMVISSLFTLVGYKDVELGLTGVLQALSFAFVPLFSYLLLKEKITRQQIVGITIIIVGLIIYSV